MSGSGSDTLRDLADESFATVDRGLPPQRAIEVLNDRRWGVVLDAEGTPPGVLTTAELSAAAQTDAGSLKDPRVPYHPAVVVDGGQTVAEFVESDAVTFLDLGIPAVVVMSDGVLDGLLSIKVVE